MAKTAEEIITLIRTLIRAESDSDVPAIQDSFLLTAISDANIEWLRAFRKGGGNAPIEVQRETGYTLIGDTELNGVALTGAATITTNDSSNGESTGRVVIWEDDMPDLVDYSANSGTVLTVDTAKNGVSFDHADAAEVAFLYALPTNFRNFRRSQDYGDGVQLDGSPLTYMEGPPEPSHFSMVTDGTTKYLWFHRSASGNASVWYDKTSSVIDSTDDTVDVPDDYQFFLAWRGIELALFGRGDNTNLLGYAQGKADKVKLEALKDRNIGRRLRVRPFNIVGDTGHIPQGELE